jgi:protein Mpv17
MSTTTSIVNVLSFIMQTIAARYMMHSGRMLAGKLRQFALSQNTRLLLVNTGTCCVLYAMGDVCRQKIEGHDIHWTRTGRMAIFGLCLGPLDHLWYTALDRYLPAITAATVGRKVLLDQLIMAPICCSLFFIGK